MNSFNASRNDDIPSSNCWVPATRKASSVSAAPRLSWVHAQSRGTRDWALLFESLAKCSNSFRQIRFVDFTRTLAQKCGAQVQPGSKPNPAALAAQVLSLNASSKAIMPSFSNSVPLCRCPSVVSADPKLLCTHAQARRIAFARNFHKCLAVGGNKFFKAGRILFTFAYYQEARADRGLNSTPENREALTSSFL